MADKQCPLYREPCAEHKCRWYIQLLGADPQTGEQLSKWGCAVEFIPVLLIENAKETRQTAAAVESARNESVRNAQAIAGGLAVVAEAARSARTLKIERLPNYNRVLEEKKEEQCG